MRQLLITFGAILFAFCLLRYACDAPLWAAVIGGWAFWAAVRPKEWM